MINYNGNLNNKSSLDLINRAFLFGDSVFETIKIVNNKICFWEDHYLRLMSSLRIIRIEIPILYTPEYFEDQILKTISRVSINFSGRVRLSIFRSGEGLYTPKSMEPTFIIHCFQQDKLFFEIESSSSYKVDLFKDYYVNDNLLSNLKTNNKIINVLAAIYSKENEIDNCIILNSKKNVVEFLNGNLFLIKGNTIKTPPLSSGCLRGVMRKKIIDYIKFFDKLTLKEIDISPFELLSADEIWVTNSIKGIIPVTDYRKKSLSNTIAAEFVNFLNKKIFEN
jgi:branched-chain amino acid aminotransferase